ncbi:MAG: hypothetical protein ABIG31_00515 [Candidatus Omnitrophota bacterium]
MSKKILRFFSLLLCFCFVFEQSGFAQVAGQLDISGHIAQLRSSFIPDKFRPLHLRYLSYDNLNNNFKLLLDRGDLKNIKEQDVEVSTRTLLNYFFVGINLPNDSFWVNLRPDSEDQVIDDALARTDAGKILLEADLQLKKDTAKFTSPQTPEGKVYWEKLYQKAEELFGTSNITIPTLTRPWIVPGEIIIRESQDNAYIYKATLKVMLEQDYLKGSAVYNFDDPRLKELNEYASELIRESIIPKLTKDVNIAKRYAPLRQVYYSLILAQWFKARLYGKGGLYSYLIDKGNLNGLTSKTPWSKSTYFKEYQRSFKEGEYDLKVPVSTPFGQTIRSYFSGGIAFSPLAGGEGGIMGAIKNGTIAGSPARPEPPLYSERIIGISFKGGDIGSPSEIGDIVIEHIPLEKQETVGSPMEKKAASSAMQGKDQSGIVDKEISRRGFLKWGLGTVAALATVNINPQKVQASEETTKAKKTYGKFQNYEAYESFVIENLPQDLKEIYIKQEQSWQKSRKGKDKKDKEEGEKEYEALRKTRHSLLAEKYTLYEAHSEKVYLVPVKDLYDKAGFQTDWRGSFIWGRHRAMFVDAKHVYDGREIRNRQAIEDALLQKAEYHKTQKKENYLLMAKMLSGMLGLIAVIVTLSLTIANRKELIRKYHFNRAKNLLEGKLKVEQVTLYDSDIYLTSPKNFPYNYKFYLSESKIEITKGKDRLGEINEDYGDDAKNYQRYSETIRDAAAKHLLNEEQQKTLKALKEQLSDENKDLLPMAFVKVISKSDINAITLESMLIKTLFYDVGDSSHRAAIEELRKFSDASEEVALYLFLYDNNTEGLIKRYAGKEKELIEQLVTKAAVAKYYNIYSQVKKALGTLIANKPDLFQLILGAFENAPQEEKDIRKGIITSLSKQSGFLVKNLEAILKQLNPALAYYVAEITILYRYFSHPDFLIEPILNGVFNDIFRSPELDKSKLTTEEFINKFSEEVLKNEKIDPGIKEQLLSYLLAEMPIYLFKEGLLRAIRLDTRLSIIFITYLIKHSNQSEFLSNLALFQAFNKELIPYLPAVKRIYSSMGDPALFIEETVNGTLNKAFKESGGDISKFIENVFISKEIGLELKQRFTEKYFSYFCTNKTILSAIQSDPTLSKSLINYWWQSPEHFTNTLRTTLEVFNPEIAPYTEEISRAFGLLDDPAFLIEKLLNRSLNDALNSSNGSLLEAVKSQPNRLSELISYLNQKPAIFFNGIESILKVVNPLLYSDIERVKAIYSSIEKPATLLIPGMINGSLNAAFINAKGKTHRFLRNVLEDNKIDVKLKAQLLKQSPSVMITRALEINIKLARYLKEKANNCEKPLERLSNPSFKSAINEIAYNLNREITLHPAEKRLGEDEKTSLLDVLFAAKDTIGIVKETFDKYFRNEPNQYYVPIPDLNALLEYVSIDKIKELIRTIGDDPKLSLDEMTRNIKQKLQGYPNAEFVLRRIEWILSNLFVLQQKIDELEPISQAMQLQGKNTYELRRVLQEIDKANKLAELNNIASDNKLNLIDILKLKLESILQEARESFLTDAIITLDMLSINEQQKEELFTELSVQYRYQPSESKNRIYLKILFNQSTDNSVILKLIDSLKGAGKIEGPKKAVFANKFLSDSRDTLVSNTLIFQYLEAIKTLLDDNQQKKEAWKQLRSLYQDRQYATTKLSYYPESITRTIAELFKQIELPKPAVQMPHIFFEALLRISPEMGSLNTIRQLIASMNANKGFRDQLATLKNKLYEQLVFFSGYSYDQKGELLSKLLKAISAEFDPSQIDNSDKFYDKLMFYLEQYSKAIDTYLKAQAKLFPEHINNEFGELSKAIIDDLLSTGQNNDSKINGLAEKLALIEADVLLARFKTQIKTIENEGEFLEKLKQYAAHNSRFKWTDHQGRNIYRLIDIYLRTISGAENGEIYNNIFEALRTEVGNDFKQWKYASNDYGATIDEIINIEAENLPQEEQALIKEAKGKAKKENTSLYEELKNIDGLKDLKERIEKIGNWQQTIQRRLEEGLTAEFTGDFYTLFNIGNYPGSTACQSCAYGNDLNRGLTGYLVNGTNKVVALLDANRRVITRRIVRLRILEDEQGIRQPAIFVEESSQFGSKGIDELYGVLDIVSQKTGLPVVASLYRPVQTTKVQQGVNKKYKIELFQGRSEFDYSDLYGNSVPGKINTGLYRQTDASITTGLFDLLVKPVSSSPVTETYFMASAGSPMEQAEGAAGSPIHIPSPLDSNMYLSQISGYLAKGTEYAYKIVEKNVSLKIAESRNPSRWNITFQEGRVSRQAAIQHASPWWTTASVAEEREKVVTLFVMCMQLVRIGEKSEQIWNLLSKASGQVKGIQEAIDDAQEGIDALTRILVKEKDELWPGKPGYRVTDRAAHDEYIKKGGWKLHLTVQPESYPKIDEWLWNNHKGQYKLLAGGDPGEKDFTVYVGSRDDVTLLIQRIARDKIDNLLEPSNAGSEDRLFTDKIAGRFDISSTRFGKRDFVYYGSSGVPFDREAADARFSGKLGGSYDQKAHVRRITNNLEKEYGGYFTGPQDKNWLQVIGAAGSPMEQKPKELDIDEMSYSQFYRNNSLEYVMGVLNGLPAETLKAQDESFLIRLLSNLVNKVRRDKDETKEQLVKEAIEQIIDKVLPEMGNNKAYKRFIDFIYTHFYYKFDIQSKETRKEGLAIVYPLAKELLDNTSLDLVDLLLSDNQFSLFVLKVYVRAAGIITIQHYPFLKNTENLKLIGDILNANRVDTDIQLGLARLAREEGQIIDQYRGGMSSGYKAGKDFLKEIKDAKDIKLLFEVLFHEIGHNVLYGFYQSNEARLLLRLFYSMSALDYSTIDEFFADWMTKELSNHMDWPADEFFKFMRIEEHFELSKKNGYEADEQHIASRAQIQLLQEGGLDMTAERLLEAIFKVLPTEITNMPLPDSDKARLAELSGSYIKILKDNGRTFLERTAGDYEMANKIFGEMQNIIGKVILGKSNWLFEILCQCFPGVQPRDVSMVNEKNDTPLNSLAGSKKTNKLTNEPKYYLKMEEIAKELTPEEVVFLIHSTVRIFVPVKVAAGSPMEQPEGAASPMEQQEDAVDLTFNAGNDNGILKFIQKQESKKAWVVFADMKKLNLRDRYYREKIANFLIGDVLTIAERVVGKYGGKVARKGYRSDEVIMVLPGELSKEKVDEIIQKIQSEIRNEYSVYGYAEYSKGSGELPISIRQRAKMVSEGVDNFGILFSDGGLANDLMDQRHNVPQSVFIPYLPAGAVLVEGAKDFDWEKLQQALGEARKYQGIAKERSLLSGVQGLMELRKEERIGEKLLESAEEREVKRGLESAKAQMEIERNVLQNAMTSEKVRFEIEGAYATFMRLNLYAILKYVMQLQPTEDKTYVVRGPPDSFFFVKASQGKWQIILVKQSFVLSEDSDKKEAFEKLREASRRVGDGEEGRYGFKVINDYFLDYFGDQLIALDSWQLRQGLGKGGLLGAQEILDELAKVREQINVFTSKKGFLVELEATVINSEDISSAKPEVLPEIIEKLNDARLPEVKIKYNDDRSSRVKLYSENKEDATWQAIETGLQAAEAEKRKRAFEGLVKDDVDAIIAHEKNIQDAMRALPKEGQDKIRQEMYGKYEELIRDGSTIANAEKNIRALLKAKLGQSAGSPVEQTEGAGSAMEESSLPKARSGGSGDIVAGTRGKDSIGRQLKIEQFEGIGQKFPDTRFGPKDRYQIRDGKINFGDLTIEVRVTDKISDTEGGMIEDNGIVVKDNNGKFYIIIRAGSSGQMLEALYHEFIACLSIAGGVQTNQEINLIHIMAIVESLVAIIESPSGVPILRRRRTAVVDGLKKISFDIEAIKKERQSKKEEFDLGFEMHKFVAESQKDPIKRQKLQDLLNEFYLGSLDSVETAEASPLLKGQAVVVATDGKEAQAALSGIVQEIILLKKECDDKPQIKPFFAELIADKIIDTLGFAEHIGPENKKGPALLFKEIVMGLSKDTQADHIQEFRNQFKEEVDKLKHLVGLRKKLQEAVEEKGISWEDQEFDQIRKVLQAVEKIIRKSSSPLEEEKLGQADMGGIDASAPLSIDFRDEGKGGIDLRNLPSQTVVQQAPIGFSTSSTLPALPAGRHSAPMPLSELNNEWQQIENMLNAGIIPSCERIREYLAVSCQSQDCSQRIDSVLACLADILRLEEERAALTEPALKEILVLLESDKPADEMQLALSRINVPAGELKLLAP